MAYGNTQKDGQGNFWHLLVDDEGRLVTQTGGRAAEGAAAAGDPLLVGGRYDATDRALDDGDVGALAIDPAGRTRVSLDRAAHWLVQATLQDLTASESTPYVLVDLSDSVNFPHTATSKVWLKKLLLNCEIESDGRYIVHVGIVKENDGTDGSADWIYVFHLETVDNATDSTGRFSDTVDFCQGGDPRGICLEVSGGALLYVVTNASQDGNANWQNDVARASPVGTSNPGVGDLVVYVEETSGTGTLPFTITALYATE